MPYELGRPFSLGAIRVTISQLYQDARNRSPTVIATEDGMPVESRVCRCPSTIREAVLTVELESRRATWHCHRCRGFLG